MRATRAAIAREEARKAALRAIMQAAIDGGMKLVKEVRRFASFEDLARRYCGIYTSPQPIIIHATRHRTVNGQSSKYWQPQEYR